MTGDCAVYGCRILLAEDSGPARAFYQELFTRAGAEVTAVADGAAALRAFRNAQSEGIPFDVVILDHDMPVLDGAAVAASIRADGFRGALLGLTAGVNEREAKAWHESGCIAVIPKALSPPSIISRIGALRHNMLPDHLEQEKPQKARRASGTSVTGNNPFGGIDIRDLASVPQSLLEIAERLVPDNSTGPSNERRFHRRHVATECLTRPIDADFQPTGPAQRSVLVDVSEGGARLFCTRHPTSRLLAVRLNLKRPGAAEMAMTICRVTPSGLYYDVGGAFLARFDRASDQ